MTEIPTGDERGSSRSAITDRRVTPTGVLPRQLQMWLMVGIAVVIVLIILITGHREPPAPAVSTPSQSPIALAPADRIRSYQQQLAAEEERQRRALEGKPVSTSADATRASVPVNTPGAAAQDERRQLVESLRADNVSLSHRTAPSSTAVPRAPVRGALGPNGVAPPLSVESLEALARTLSQRPLPPAAAANAVASSTPAPGASPNRPNPAAAASSADPQPDRETPVTAEHPAPGPRFTLFEGTVIETALLNRIDGTFAGPVVCHVTSPVYAQDRRRVLIPQGARVLGAASSVQGWGDTRLAVSFHRLLMPDGHTYTLDRFKGLDQVGEAGVRDAVDRHYLQVFGASLAIGALSGLAQYNTRSGYAGSSFSDEFRQSTGASIANSATRILDRYLNVLPTLTIREGHRIKVYLTNDFELPAYVAGAPGGVR